jgi:hypothetical protein
MMRKDAERIKENAFNHQEEYLEAMHQPELASEEDTKSHPVVAQMFAPIN